MNLINKKAQVTLFVIIGAVLLFGAIIYLSISSSLQLDKPGLDIPDVSLEARPAHNLVTTCLDGVAEEALRKIGTQGGTYNPPAVRYPPYRSEAVEFAPDTIPYWRHLEDCEVESGCESVFVPPLCKASNSLCKDVKKGDDSIEEQVELYIEENLESCVRGFENIGEQYDITIDGEPDVQVFFLEGETDFKLSYPITITSLSTGNTEKVDNYITSFELDVYNMYKFANEILEFERTTNFYETETMNLITIYSGIDKPLPPTEDVTFFGQSGNIWIQQEVSDILQYDLLPFMSIIRFMNAKNYFPIVDDYSVPEKYRQYSEGIYERMTPKLSNKLYDFNVYHHYLYQPIFLQINDGSQVVKPTDVMEEIGPFAKMIGLFMKDYRFDYHISYPLVVALEDEDAFAGDGFTFQFAVEVNIRNNIPAYYEFESLTIPAPFDANLNSFEQHLPQEITIYTENKYTQEPLDDVIISYVCGREYSVGSTIIDSSGKASLTTTLPYCEIGGYLRYQKIDYLGESVSYNNLMDGSDEEFTFGLWPVVEREIIIRKRTAADIAELDGLGEDTYLHMHEKYTDLSINQQVLFNIERQEETPFDTTVPLIGFLRYVSEPEILDPIVIYNEAVRNIESSFDASYINETMKNEMIAGAKFAYENPDPVEVQEHYYIDLVPGTYLVDMTLLDKNGVHIPADEFDITEDAGLLEQITTELFVDEDQQVVELPEQNFSTWVLGGGLVDVTFSASQIYRNNSIEFYVLEMPRPESWDDMMELEELAEYQEGRHFYLNPKY